MIKKAVIKDKAYDYEVALAGCPNVGKTTIFNHLTGLRQHTGNWAGKTVENAYGYHEHNARVYRIVDLPGTYSLSGGSLEELEALNYIKERSDKIVVIVTGALSLERNLSLAIQISAFTDRAMLCVNMMDEAERANIKINLNKLALKLGMPVIACSSRDKRTLYKLNESIYRLCEGKQARIGGLEIPKEYIRLNIGSEECAEVVGALAEKIADHAVEKPENAEYKRIRADRILTSRAVGIPIMLALYGLLFWITAAGANYPSELLGRLFEAGKDVLNVLCADILRAPPFLRGILIDGVYTTLSWVVSVMLPPMAIFFPLFSILEESGYLPRIAFNLDGFFDKRNISSKQCLTMSMGMGCNACGVMGCRIIESERDRNIAVVTNNFIPCNGRLPALFAMITVFFASGGKILDSLTGALMMVLVFSAAVTVTLITSSVLAKTIFKGRSAGFTLELPPYRRPDFFRIIIRTFVDKTMPVLGRAAAAAAPAGAVIWFMNNVTVNGSSIISICVGALEPLGIALGLDGVILLAFVLGFPANETVIPIMLMAYLSTGVMIDYASYRELGAILAAHGWTAVTALCFMIMCVFHFPCATTCVTIKKETGSKRLTAISILLPTCIGAVLCFAVNGCFSLLHIFF